MSRVAEYSRLIKRVTRLGSRLIFRILTTPARVLPDFFVLGPARSGTTFLYQLLLQHPSYVKPFNKELGYAGEAQVGVEEWASLFTLNETLFSHVPKPLLTSIVRCIRALYLRGDAEGYRKLFPLRRTMGRVRRLHRNAVTGEFIVLGLYAIDTIDAFPFHCVADRAKFITILRDPVEFAVSLYGVETTRGYRKIEAGLSIDEFVRRPGDFYLDPAIARGFKDQLRAWRPLFAERPHFCDAHFSLVTAMMAYVVFIKLWAARLGRDRLLVLSFDDLCNRTRDTMATVSSFLEIPHVAIPASNRVNAGTLAFDQVPAETLAYLRDVARPYNEELFDFIGRDLGWNADFPRGTSSS